jgi:hypothetical protein
MASKPATKRAKQLTKAQKQANKAAKAKEKQTDMYANDIGTLQTAFERNMPAALAFEAKNRPAYTGLNLGDVSAFTQGVGGQAGYYDQLRNATSEAGRMIGDARSAELGQMTGQAGQARGLMQEMSPEAAARVQQAQDQAVQAQGLAGLYQGQSQGYVNQANTLGNEAFARRGYLSPEQMRNAQQEARGAAQAAGRVGGNLGIASEVLNRENALASRRGEAASAGLSAFNQFQAQQGTMGNLRGEAQGSNVNAYNLGQQFYSQPGLQLLGSTPLSYQAGQQNLGVGLGQIGAATPKLFDAGAALNLGATERANKLAKEAADAQAKAAKRAATLGLVGDVFKSATSMFSFGV